MTKPLFDSPYPGWIQTVKIKVPMALALGLYEHLTDDQLFNHFWDISHECERRKLDPQNGERTLAD